MNEISRELNLYELRSRGDFLLLSHYQQLLHHIIFRSPERSIRRKFYQKVSEASDLMFAEAYWWQQHGQQISVLK